MSSRKPRTSDLFHSVVCAVRQAALALMVLQPTTAVAQDDIGSCEMGAAFRDLDANLVDARLFNTGNLFFGPEDEARYVVPKGSGKSPLYAAGLIVGGKVGGELRTAVATYLTEYWPGPLGEDALPLNRSDCGEYDMIYGVARSDLRVYAETGVPSEDLTDWPYHLGAPVLDGDGMPGNYDLEAGDRPALLGDETAWWVMNDAGNVHERSGTLPLGVEVRVSAFSHAPSSLENVLASALAHTTFYSYQLHYRGSTELTEAYFGIFADPDLGSAADDFVGTDTMRNMIFVYNAEDEDDRYGIPPALGFVMLGAPEGVDEDRLLTASMYYVSGGPGGVGYPGNAEGYYNNLQGRFKDGVPMKEGGLGYYAEGAETRYTFPGDPVEQVFWSEENADDSGNRNQPSERGMLLASGPLSMQPGDTRAFKFAIVFAQGEDRLDSIVQLREAVDAVTANASELFTPDATVDVSSESPNKPPQTVQLDIYPNPVRDRAHLRFTAPTGAPVRIEIYDVLGRRVDHISIPAGGPGNHSVPIDVLGFGTGMYVVRLKQSTPNGFIHSASAPFVVVR